MYALVLLQETGAAVEEPDHEPFIDDLIERNMVLLGGPFDAAIVPGALAAYVLRCADRAEVDAVVATDPLVTSGAYLPAVVSWDLVGINLGAIDPGLTLDTVLPS